MEIQEAIAELLPTPVPELERMMHDNEITDRFTLPAYVGQVKEFVLKHASSREVLYLSESKFRRFFRGHL